MTEGRSTRRNTDLETLGAIVAEAVDRRRAGQSPSAEEYWRRHPHLRPEIEAHFETIALLESPLAARLRPPGLALDRRIASLPEDLRELIVLREGEKRTWKEIADLLGRPEIDLRRAYARAIQSLIESPGRPPEPESRS